MFDTVEAMYDYEVVDGSTPVAEVTAAVLTHAELDEVEEQGGLTFTAVEDRVEAEWRVEYRFGSRSPCAAVTAPGARVGCEEHEPVPEWSEPLFEGADVHPRDLSDVDPSAAVQAALAAY